MYLRVPGEVRRGQHMPRTEVTDQPSCGCWVLTRVLCRAAGALSRGAISPAPELIYSSAKLLGNPKWPCIEYTILFVSFIKDWLKGFVSRRLLLHLNEGTLKNKNKKKNEPCMSHVNDGEIKCRRLWVSLFTCSLYLEKQWVPQLWSGAIMRRRTQVLSRNNS